MKDLILGNHLYFVREGTIIAGEGGGTVSATYKPPTEPEDNYVKMPTVDDWEPKVVRNFVTRKQPSPGIYRTRRKIPLSTVITHAFSLQEWNEMTFAELLLGGNKPVDGVFVSGERTELLRGWWIVQGYEQGNAPIVTLNVWGEATIDSYKFGEKLDPYALVIEELYSTLNTSLVENLS